MEHVKIRTVYVDMDGVLANFSGYYFTLFKKNADEVEDKELWDNINRYGKAKFFKELPWIAGSQDMWNFIVKNFMRVKILSALGKSDTIDKQTSIGKMYWLSKHLPNLSKKDIILVENKHRKRHYSKPGDIIIDDTPIVIDEWRHKGGIGIMFQSAAQVQNELEKYIYENGEI